MKLDLNATSIARVPQSARASGLGPAQRLKKELGLFDVFAVSTGAMFSSGFFLLPGLAFAKAGPAVVLAYLLAGILILPAMFSKAELSTALPRAGGTYFFLDRSLGPLAGTVGGLGTYLALTLKTAFALIGIGAYAAFFVELPIKPVAIALTVVFVVINILGAKETTALQRWLVITLLSIMALFLVQGLAFVIGQPLETTRARFTPFMAFGSAGLLSTIGFVFVSYAGLTKVASVAEEVRNPDRNIPLGMMLSLGVTSLVYGVGVFTIVAVVDPVVLASDLTPIATAAETLFGWLPARLGLLLVVIAALAAFASTGNAGLLAASRYPLAMARDKLLPPGFATLGRFRTPVAAILATGGLMVSFIIVLDAEGIAKLASAFQLFIFILVNLAVVVMRESRIPSYDPGYRSPLYPWMQILGMISSLLLIVYMGWQAVVFTAVIVVLCLGWYFHYAARRVHRHGAIYHWFSRLGQRQFDGLDREFRGIMKEKGLRDEDPFDQIVARSQVVDLRMPTTFENAVALAAERLSHRVPHTVAEITDRFLQGTLIGHTPVSQGVAMPHFRTVSIELAEMVLVRSRHPIAFPADDPLTPEIEPDRNVTALFFLVSPDQNPAQHLRILAQVAGRVDEPSFAEAWATASNEHELREVLLRDERFVTIYIGPGATAMELAGKAVCDVDLPPNCLIAVIRREETSIIPSGDTVLEPGDRITLIGQVAGITALRALYESDRDDAARMPMTASDDMAAGACPAASAGDVPASMTTLRLETVSALKQRLLYIASRSVDREPQRVDECLDALRRLAAGTYGACVDCGESIQPHWLMLRPDDLRCLKCHRRLRDTGAPRVE